MSTATYILQILLNINNCEANEYDLWTIQVNGDANSENGSQRCVQYPFSVNEKVVIKVGLLLNIDNVHQLVFVNVIWCDLLFC